MKFSVEWVLITSRNSLITEARFQVDYTQVVFKKLNYVTNGSRQLSIHDFQRENYYLHSEHRSLHEQTINMGIVVYITSVSSSMEVSAELNNMSLCSIGVRPGSISFDC